MPWQDYLNSNPDFLKASSPGEEEPLSYAPESRGLLGDLGTSAVRGAANVVESTSAGLEQLGVSNPVDEWVKAKRKTSDVLKPDIDTVFNFDGTVARALKNLPETIVTSVGSTIGGAAVGGSVGGAPGAIVGGGANLLLSMGLGTYKTKKDEYLAKNPSDEDGASKYALIHASSEVGLEAVSDVAAMATFGGSKLLTELGKQGIKSTARNLLSISGKEIAKNAAISSAVELGTEEATYGIQATADKAYGMGQGVTAEGILETGVSTIGMSLLFGGLGAKYTINQKNQLKEALGSTNKDRQSSAANIIKLELEKSGDNDLASAWDSYTSSSISNGLPVKLDDKFVEMGQKINDASKVTIEDVTSTNPDIQKHATDKILEAAGIGSDGSLVVPPPDFEEIQGGRSIEKEALAYNQTRNLGNKVVRRGTEIQQGRQAIEARRADEQLSTPVEDPIKTLESAYQDQEYNQYAPELPPQQLTKIELEERDKSEIKRVEENDISVFEEVAARYTKDKNQTKTIADLLQSPDDQLKLKMFKYMQELSPDTNTVDPAKVEANLKEMEAKDLAKKEDLVAKGVKGSKKVKGLKKEVEEIKARIEARKEQVVPVVVPISSVVEEVKGPELIQPEIVTVGSEDATKGVESATTMTPEDIVQNKQEIAKFEKETGTSSVATDYDSDELTQAAEATGDPLLINVVLGDWTAVKNHFDTIKVKDRMASLSQSLKRLPPEVAKKYWEILRESTGKAMKLAQPTRVKDIEGSKTTHAIKWTRDETGGKEVVQVGIHKETGQEVEIRKADNLETVDEKGKPKVVKDQWDIIVEGKLVDTVAGKVNARLAVEGYVSPLGSRDEEGPRKVPKGPSKELEKILDSVGWKVEKALPILKEKYGDSQPDSEIYLKQLIQKKEANVGKLQEVFKDADSTLNYIISKGTAVEKSIAKLILANTSKDKRKNIKVVVELNGPTPFYRDGVVTLTSDDTRSALHEMIHAITVGELIYNKKLNDKIIGVMGRVKQYTLDNDIFTKYQIEFLSENTTSKAWKENKSGVFFGDDEKLAYALINPKEFLSQALSDPKVQEILKGIELENPKGLIRTLWDAIVEIVGQALGLSPMHHNALSEILTISTELMRQEGRGRPFGIHGDISSFIDTQVEQYVGGVSSKETIKEAVVDKYKELETRFSKTFQSTYEALSTISKPIAEKVRELDFNTLSAITDRTNKVTPFEKKFRNLSTKRQKELSFYLNNYGANAEVRVRLDSFLKTNNMHEDFQSVLSMLKDMHSEFETFGLNKFDEEEFYYPRKVKDLDRLVAYLRKQKDWGVMDEALKHAEEEHNKKNPSKPMTNKDRADIVGKMIATGRLPSAYLKSPSGTKKRSIKAVNAEMMKFYYSPMETLGMTIREGTERVEINRMLGVTNRKKTIQDIRKKYKEVLDLISKKVSKGEINKASKELQELQAKLPEMDQQIENSIGDITARMVGKRAITEDQQRRAKDLIRARITEVGVGRFVGAVRQAALLGSLTQLGTGLVQVSDNVWSMYRSGLLPTLQAAIKVGLGKDTIRENFIDFQSPLKEFSSVDRFTDNMLKFSGLSFMDNIGKKISMEASLIASKKQSFESFKKQWSYAFGEGDRLERVYEDVQEGRVTRDVKYLVVSNIADFQPIFKSEQSQQFLQAGNGRIFYLLKSYALKSSNNFYRESIQKIREGDVKGGLSNLAKLGTMFVLIGASSDWIKDWLNGASPEFSQSMVDTLLTLGLVSRYTISKGEKEGFLKSYVSNILPPTGVIDSPASDLYNLITGDPTIKSLKLVPGIGTISYNRFTDEGSKKIITNTKREIMEDALSGSISGERMAELNSMIRKYNPGKPKKDKVALVTFSAINTARKKERDKNVK